MNWFQTFLTLFQNAKSENLNTFAMSCRKCRLHPLKGAIAQFHQAFNNNNVVKKIQLNAYVRSPLNFSSGDGPPTPAMMSPEQEA